MCSLKSKEWNRLDNAAKLFPHTSNKRDTKVFRFSCELTEDVDKLILEQALAKTLELYPIFKSVLKHGLFWYYLERSNLAPVVQEEKRPPCSPLYDENAKNLLFDVTYYNNRINLEVFHALSDGTGALQFLRTLVCHYIALKHSDIFINGVPALDYDASYSQKNEDSFQKYYVPYKRVRMTKTRKAYKIRGSVLPEGRMKVIEGVMSTSQLLKISHEYGTTITIFLAAVYLISIYQEMPTRHKNNPIILSIPVNLRNYFHSETTRNFFGVVYVGYNFNEGSVELKDVIKHVSSCFEKELTTDSLSKRISKLTSIEHNYAARAIPLPIKDIILRIAGNIVRSASTSSFSNVGKVTMPQGIEDYIQRFNVFVSTDNIQACLCSFKDNLTVSFTSALVSTEIQKRFFRFLAENGINVRIVSNIVNDE